VRPVWKSRISRASEALLVALAAAVAWTAGGGADARTPPPRSNAADTSAANRARTQYATPESTVVSREDAYQVRTRLVEALSDAAIDVPNLAAAQPFFGACWRKMRGPWAHAPGIAGQLLTTIALRTSGQGETQWAVATQTGQTWVPDVRVWNMNEGSFDQREAIYAPTPATLRFRLAVPLGARLRFSPAVAVPLPATTLFGVTVVDVSGDQHYVSQTRIPPADDRRWLDLDVDLSPWAGQLVELQLRTWTEKPADFEKRWIPAASGDDADGDGPVVPPMALALWGDPVIVAKERTRAPYNVLWIVVDAMRPDIAAALHDPVEDAAKLGAPHPPLDALLPAIPGLMPALDHLAARGVHFTHAWSSATWTRPGTLAMLTGKRSTEVGIDTSNWVQPAERVARYYASDPPLVPRLMRAAGMTTAAFVNNFFMTGYASVGLDMGFERITDHRYRTRDTALIAYDALAWLEGHTHDRFFLFVNFNSPHEPYDPPPEMLARVRPPSGSPLEGHVRAYMAEAAKDDTAIGVLLDKLDALGLSESTLVVVTSDHGETLSAAHDGFGFIGSDKMPMRFHHAVGNFEETTRVPIVLALPGVIDGGRAVPDRVRSIDIAPTVVELEGLVADARMSGQSVLPLIRGHKEAEPRLVISEGRLSRAVLSGKWRLVTHDAPAHPPALEDGGVVAVPEDELYDLDEDPGERRNVARSHPDVVAEMHARLAAEFASAAGGAALSPSLAPFAAAPGGSADGTSTVLPTVHFRFAGAGRVRRVVGTLTVGDQRHPAAVSIEAVGVAREAIRGGPPRIDFELATSPDAAVGFNIRVDPAAAPIAWQFFLDHGPWPDDATFVGPFGLAALAAKRGIVSDEARAEAYAPAPPVIDPARDLGLFVTCDRAVKADESVAEGPATGGEAAKEMQRVLQQWGYAHGSH
jgi:choline-sulfatase